MYKFFGVFLLNGVVVFLLNDAVVFLLNDAVVFLLNDVVYFYQVLHVALKMMISGIVQKTISPVIHK